jgi:hypothetical protein
MSIVTYKLLHILGIVLIVMPLGAMALHLLNGGTRQSNQSRKLLAITHGVGMLVTLVAGFGMLARLEIGGFPTWVAIKTAIWLVLGGALGILFRAPGSARAIWFLAPLLTGLAGWIALHRGF